MSSCKCLVLCLVSKRGLHNFGVYWKFRNRSTVLQISFLHILSTIVCKISLFEYFSVDANFKTLFSSLLDENFDQHLAGFFLYSIFNFKKKLMMILYLPRLFATGLQLIPDVAKVSKIPFSYSHILFIFAFVIKLIKLLMENVRKIIYRRVFLLKTINNCT